MIRRPPRSTRTDTLFPYTTLFRSVAAVLEDPGTDAVLVLNCPTAIADSGDAARATLDALPRRNDQRRLPPVRSEEHTSELQSLMRISYAVFCLKQNKTPITEQIRSKSTRLSLHTSNLIIKIL